MKNWSSEKHESLEPGNGAFWPEYRKILHRLENEVEVLKLDAQHYHMSPTQSRRREASWLSTWEIRVSSQELSDKHFSRTSARAGVSGIRASCFCETKLHKNKYVVLLVLDGATNLHWAMAQSDPVGRHGLTMPKRHFLCSNQCGAWWNKILMTLVSACFHGDTVKIHQRSSQSGRVIANWRSVVF